MVSRTSPVRTARFRPWLHSSGDDKTAVTSRRRTCQVVLGLIWLLDAALQFQPYMFTKDFVNQTLASTAAGNPAVVARPITWASSLMFQHIVVYNALFALIQLALAFGLFWRPTVKVALGTSVVWSIAVWWLGEGLGGVLTGGTSVPMGAPGAVILYGFIALLVWPHHDANPRSAVALDGPLGRVAPRVLWCTLWGSFVYFLLQPGDRAPNALGAMVSGMSDGEPGWIRQMDHTVASALGNHGIEVSVAAALVCVIAGLGVCSAHTARLAVTVAVVFGAAVWLVEDFGGIFTGQGTDPSTGPLLLLLATTFWPVHLTPPFSGGTLRGVQPTKANWIEDLATSRESIALVRFVG
jgi:hypothetical protein